MQKKETSPKIVKKTLDVRKALLTKFPKLSIYPKYLVNPCIAILRWILYEKELNEFIAKNHDTTPMQCIDNGFKKLHFSYQVYHHELRRIPAKGRAIVVANHPIGSLDGLALVRMIHEIRPDVAILANDLLMHVQPLRPIFLAVDNMTKRSNRASIVAIQNALFSEKVVCFFPAGEVSRIRLGRIRDTKWNSSFIRLAEKTQSPVIPVFIKGKCTRIFYYASKVSKTLGTLLLVREMFHQKNKTIHFRIGKTIAPSNFTNMQLGKQQMAELVRKYIYRMQRIKQPTKFLLTTHEPIAAPQHRDILQTYLKEWQILGKFDNFTMYLAQFSNIHHPVLEELGRIREETFRMVGEGTGKERDIDIYDTWYEHLLLWDNNHCCLAGAYRVYNVTKNSKNKKNSHKLYTQSLFSFTKDFQNICNHGMELGRSFIYPDYWKKKNLDLLWFGIGSYFVHNPGIQYFFGPVTLSNNYPKAAKDLIVHFYSTFYGSKKPVTHAINEYAIDHKTRHELDTLYQTPDKEFVSKFDATVILKQRLQYLGVVIPSLYKQYVELCEDDGTTFHAFGVDPSFNYSVDGFIVVEIAKIKQKKYQRYTSIATGNHHK